MAALRIWGERSGARCRHDERGSGTVLAAGMVVLLMAVAAAILVVGGYLVAADHARFALPEIPPVVVSTLSTGC